MSQQASSQTALATRAEPAKRGRRALLRNAALAVTLACGLSGAWAQANTKPFQIALMNDMSGPVKDMSGPGSALAAQMAIDDFGGKVLGRKIELLTGDQLNKVDTGLALARQWYDSGVPAIFDIGISSLAIAMQELAKEKNKLAIFTSSASAELTTKYCGPNGIQWVYNAYPMEKAVIEGVMKAGAKTWYFITVDYSFGHAVQKDGEAMIAKLGGKVLGSTTHAYNATDYSSQLLQAQASGADAIALATTSFAAPGFIKQAKEFGIKATVAPLSFMMSDIKGLGLEAGQGLFVGEPYYWDRDDASRKFAMRFKDRFGGKMPNFIHVGTYSAVMHYLKSVAAAGTDDTTKVLAKMKSLPINDLITKNGSIRADGQVLHDFYVFKVKKPSESKNEWDMFTQVGTVAGKDAFREADKELCKLVK